MIDARELRVGNWTQFNDEFTWLDGYSLYLASRGDIELDPIPLTPEIIRNIEGFQERPYKFNWFYRKLKFDLSSVGVLRFHYSGKVIYIEYVHELQNLVFALTQQEITINIL